MRMRAAIDLSPAVLPIQRPGESTSFRIGMRVLSSHSSEKRGLRSTFLSDKMLQNLPYL